MEPGTMPCPMGKPYSGHEVDQTNRNSPNSREEAFAFQLHDTAVRALQMAKLGEHTGPKEFIDQLEIMRQQIDSYFKMAKT